jgi:hypothetical protein
MIKKFIYLSVLCLGVSSCSTTMVSIGTSKDNPFYVTTGELASLNTGMSKSEAKSALANVSPYDILLAQGSGCEVHQYKYRKPAKEISFSKMNKVEGLTEGEKRYIDPQDAFLVYKNDKLESVLTNAGKEDAIQLLEDIASAQAVCSEEGLRGSTDPQSLNYNPNAIFDDGSGEYCPCGYIPNPNYNEKRPESECNSKCIQVESTEKSDEENGCTNCDIIDKLSNANANVNINLDLNANNTSTSSNQASQSSGVKMDKLNTRKIGSKNKKADSDEDAEEKKSIRKLIRINK